MAKQTMRTFRVRRLLFLLGALVSGPLAAATALQAPYEDLVQVRSRNLDAVYLLPGVDFRVYSKVMIDPVQVSFRKDWVKETNRSRGVSQRIDAQDAEQIAQTARSGFEAIFAGAFKKKGYEVATAPASDVLRLSPAIANLYINAPLSSGPGVSRTYTVEAGGATFVLEVRDSTTGAVLGLAIDKRATRRSGQATLTSSVTNRTDFADLFTRWADICVKGFEQVKAAAPSDAGPGKKG